jgi:6-phosphogluconolactonase
VSKLNQIKALVLNRLYRVFPTPQELAEAFAAELINQISEASAKSLSFTLALSGGSTPKLLFTVLAEKFAKSVDWNQVHLFWVDERCVPPDDPESNYGMTNMILLKKIDIPDSNIHRIKGEANPETEAIRYAEEISRYTRSLNGNPVFDHIILGMGEDGHTASIFPGNQELMFSEKLCEVSFHPVSGQKRITITGKVINNPDHITFLVTGSSKAPVIEHIFIKNTILPAFLIVPAHGEIKWLLDKKAAEFIDR